MIDNFANKNYDIMLLYIIKVTCDRNSNKAHYIYFKSIIPIGLSCAYYTKNSNTSTLIVVVLF